MRSTAGIIALTAAAGCASIAFRLGRSRDPRGDEGKRGGRYGQLVQKGDKVVVTARITGLAPAARIPHSR